MLMMVGQDGRIVLMVKALPNLNFNNVTFNLLNGWGYKPSIFTDLVHFPA